MQSHALLCWPRGMLDARGVVSRLVGILIFGLCYARGEPGRPECCFTSFPCILGYDTADLAASTRIIIVSPHRPRRRLLIPLDWARGQDLEL